jgi:hypothetical protein
MLFLLTNFGRAEVTGAIAASRTENTELCVIETFFDFTAWGDRAAE